MNPTVRRFFQLVLLWGLAVAGFALSGLPRHLPPAAVPLLVVGLTISMIVASARVPWINDAFGTIGVRGIVGLHLFRFIGGYFIWLHAQGSLPEEFAMRAGWGDVATAAGAAVLLFWPDGPGFRRALLAWNVFGAADLFLAVGTAAWLNAIRPGSMNAMGEFPLLLVPLWAVPLMLATHAAIFRRLWRTRTSAGLTPAVSA